MYICKNCGKEVFSKYGSGIYCCRSCANTRTPTEESKKKSSEKLKGCKGRVWTQEDKIKHSNIIRECAKREGSRMWKSLSQETKDKISKTNKGKTTPESVKKKLSEVAKLRNFGGSNTGLDKHKKGWYKGYWCDSSWELAFLMFNLDHNIPIERNKDRFIYTYNGETHIYTPDFKLGDTYIEIKGYETPQDEFKWSVVPNIRVVNRGGIQTYLDYTREKYGKNFTQFYEHAS